MVPDHQPAVSPRGHQTLRFGQQHGSNKCPPNLNGGGLSKHAHSHAIWLVFAAAIYTLINRRDNDSSATGRQTIRSQDGVKAISSGERWAGAPSCLRYQV